MKPSKRIYEIAYARLASRVANPDDHDVKPTVGDIIDYLDERATPKPGDVVRITNLHLRHGEKAVVLRLLPQGTMAEVRIVGYEPKPGEAYPAYPLEDLDIVERSPFGSGS